MVASVAAGTAAQYYLAQSEYYLGGREPTGRWIAAGKGLAVSVGALVERGDFECLHAGLDTSGYSLLANDGGRLTHVGGYDVTFSAPKSLSVLWGLADDALRKQLEAVQDAAVNAATDLLNREAAFCRRGHNGVEIEKVALTAAAFQHGEAWPALHDDGSTFADPALHTHVVILNLAQRSDGSYGRLDGRPIFAWKMAAGAVYHQALAAGLMECGFRIDVTGTNGIFEIAGVDPALCRYFSARRVEIENELAAMGLQTGDAPALAAAKARVTRKSKALDGETDRHVVWRERSTSLGHPPQRIVEQALLAGHQRGVELAGVVPSAAIDAVLRDLTERKSVFEKRQLMAAIAAACVGLEVPLSAEQLVDGLRTDGAVVELGRDRWGHAIYSTPEMIALESELYIRAERLASMEVTAPAAGNIASLLEQANLNDEQKTAASLACRSRGIVIVEGAPGVGKTTLLAPVAAAWASEGWRVIGASTAWKIAHQLRDDLGIEARALDSWLALAEHGSQPFLSDKTLLIIDEAGLITSQQMSRVLKEVEAARRAGHQIAIRMVGDRKQLQPIGGPGLRIVAAAIGTQRVDVILRQHEVWARDVVTAFGDGHAAQALASLDEHGCVHVRSGPAATIKALVDAWDEWRKDAPGKTGLLIAKTNAQVLALNKAARQRLRDAGEIAINDAVSLEAVTASGTSHTIDLSQGDTVRFLCRNDELGIINGTSGQVERIERASDGQARLQVRIGSRAIRLDTADVADEEGRAQIAHAYATTCYGSQGLTTTRAFVLVDPFMDRHDIHVAASRAREETHLFIDAKNLDARVKSARLLGDRDKPIEMQDRLNALAIALGRSGMTQSTLDYRPMPLRHLANTVDRRLDEAGVAEEAMPSPEAAKLPEARPPVAIKEIRRSRGLSLD